MHFSGGGGCDHFLFQGCGLAGAGVAQDFAGPHGSGALRAGNVDQHSQLAELAFEAVGFVVGKTQAHQSSGIATQGRAFARNHERVEEGLRLDEEADGGNEDGAETGEPSDQLGSDGVGFALRVEQAGVAHE